MKKAIDVRDGLINNGVKNLKEYGYPAVDKDNILTDQIYSAFFKSMLEENIGVSPTFDSAISGLIAEIDGKS